MVEFAFQFGKGLADIAREAKQADGVFNLIPALGAEFGVIGGIGLREAAGDGGGH